MLAGVKLRLSGFASGKEEEKLKKKAQSFGAEYCTDGSTTHVVGAKYTSRVC